MYHWSQVSEFWIGNRVQIWQHGMWNMLYRPRDTNMATKGILSLRLICLFYVVNKNTKEMLIKIKIIFLWLRMSVDNETVSLKFRL